MSEPIKIREERAADKAAVYALIQAAFDGRTAEPEIVEQIRAKKEGAFLSLVAEKAGELLAHLFFSTAEIHNDDGLSPIIALGPVAVLPAYQGQGIGSRLIDFGLATCEALGEETVILLGNPAFYGRFGFERADLFGVTPTFNVAPQYFMIRGPVPRAGVAHYQPEFDEAD